VIGLDLRGAERVDVEYAVDERPVGVWEDLPFDPQSHEIVFTVPTDAARAAPDGSHHRIRIVSVGPAGRRVLGECIFHHLTWSPDWRTR
jgi:hypothetical protein